MSGRFAGNRPADWKAASIAARRDLNRELGKPWTIIEARRHIMETDHKDFQVTIGPMPFSWTFFKCLECGV